MELIIATIKAGDTGANVANLQETILLLLAKNVFSVYEEPNHPTLKELEELTIRLKKELDQSLFGEATQQLIRHFQIQQGLGDSLYGMVEDKTAVKLNEWLKKLGALDSNFVVEGRVFDKVTGKTAADVTVRAFDLNKELGKARSDQNGRYRIEFSEAGYEHVGPTLVVRVFNEKGEGIGSSKQINNADRRTEVDVEVDAGINTTPYRVHGVVRDSDSKPVKHFIVQAFDRDLRILQPLGTASTDENGAYRIDYKLADFQLGDSPLRRAPWLIVEVREKPEGDVLARQEVQRAEPIQYVELITAGAVTSEWQRISEAIEPLLKGQGKEGEETSDLLPSDLNASDIDFIVTDTELDRVAVEDWVASSRMVRDAVLRLTEEHAAQQDTLRKNGWPFFYGIARQGLMRDLDAMLRETAANWQKAWSAARAANRSPALDEIQLKLLVDALELLQRLQQLDPVRSANSEFARVLASTPLPLPTKVALDALSVFHEKGLADPDAILKLTERHPDAETPIKTFVRCVRVHQLVSGHEGLSRLLNARLEGESDSISPLAALSSAEWMSLAGKASVSQGRGLLLQAQVERQHPLTALAARVDAGQLQLPGVTSGEITVLIKEQGATVDKILRGVTPVKDNGGEEAPAAYKAFRDLGRYGRTGLSMEIAGLLMGNGITTPAAAHRSGPETISEIIEKEYSKDASAELVNSFFAYVEPVLNGANGFVTDVMISSKGPKLMFEENKTPLPDSVRENLPSLPGLFGDLDECTCKSCESMLSQSAYLVDLLNLLKKCKGAFTELTKRRPGITTELKLSCESAKEIQYIELALEVLQKAVGNNPYQTTASAIFPWKLPFDRSYAETKAYLGKFGVTRLDLLTLGAHTAEKDLAAETLGLSMTQTLANGAISEWDLITKTRSGADLWRVYGFSPDGAGHVSLVDPASGKQLNNLSVTDALLRISVLLDRTGLDLDSLEKIIATQYIGKLSISNRQQCKTSIMRLVVPAGQIEAVLDRIHRFVRLSKKLSDWSVKEIDLAKEIDSAIVAFNGVESSTTTEVDRENLLIKLALIKRLHDRYKFSIADLVKLPASINRIYPSLGLSTYQFSLLKTLTGLGTSTAFDWAKFENLCVAVDRISEADMTIEQTAEVLLPGSQLAAFGLAHSPSLKTSEQVTELLKSLQQRLKSVVAVRPDVTIESQTAEALTAIYDASIANKLVEAIHNAGATNADPRVPATDDPLLLILYVAPGGTHVLGEWLPLLSVTEATAILTVTATATGNLSTDERFTILLEGIAKRRRERELISAISGQCGLPESEVGLLLSSRLLLDSSGTESTEASTLFLDDNKFWNATTVPADVLSRLQNWMDRLYRLITLTTALGLDRELMSLADLVAIGAIGNRTGINWRDMFATTWPVTGNVWSSPDWQALLDIVWLQRSEQLSRATLHDLLDNLAARTDQNLRGPSHLRRAFELLLLARRLGANDAQLKKVANLANNALASSTANTLLQTRVVDEEDLKAALQKIDDQLRQQRRDALVAYLLHSKGMRHANDLYEYYLIDPQVEPCLETSQLLEAITATQLFAQRILFGLEKGISASDELKRRWTWMRNYRVWEANRKVFLFPENWLYPELRDDKSSSFKQLESALGQGELTQDLVRQSFGQFLDDVAQMGHVQVLGMYEDVNEDRSRRDLYVIGRTSNPPYIYYWRSCIDFGSNFMEWSPWQRIELDILGDHVLIFVLRNDLYIAWPKFKRPDESEDSKRPNIWEISFAWSRLQGNKWARVEVSRDPRELDAKPFQDERSGFAFRCRTAGSRAELVCYTRASTSELSKKAENFVESQEEYLTEDLRGNFNSRCVRNSWNYFGQIFIPGSDNDPSSSNSKGPERDDLIGAVLIVSWECWVKAKDLNNNVGYVKLADNQTPSYEALLYSETGDKPFGTGNTTFETKEIGENMGIWVVTHNDEHGVRLSIPEIQFKAVLEVGTTTATRRAQHSTVAKVSSTAADKQKTVNIKLVVEFPENKTPTLAELGIESSKTFTPAASFVLDSNGQAFWASPSGKQRLTVLEHCDIFMNGQQEDGHAQPLKLIAENPSLALVPFNPPYDADNLYWVVGAASVRDNQKDAPDVWYYKEGLNACFVDAHRHLKTRYSSFTAYAASYVEAAEYRLAWSSEESLFTDHYQSGDFGAKQLPALGGSGDPDLWREQRDGNLAFDARMPYACYNWEVFFHAPLLIADQLSKQHKFEDAEQWLRLVFDPTSGGPETDTKRFLKFRVFKELDLNKQVIDDLTALAQVARGLATENDTKAVQKLIDRWRDAPFRPFLIARRRHIAFLWRTLFAYLDNLIAWGDSLYRRDTFESINEATMLYILAERILGRRPQLHEGTSKRVTYSYAELEGKWDDFANYWINVGTDSNVMQHYNRNDTKRPPEEVTGQNIRFDTVDRKQPSPDGMLYFCMPFNDKIVSYSNTIEARLSNIRNCRNIEGIERKLPLMDAPIDPELLIRATAAGLDLADVISGLYAPPPHYRYSILSARAVELTNEAKALGAAMLSAIEKRDAEQLSQLRSSNEIALLKLVQEVRTLQITEAESNLEALRATRKSVGARYNQYQRLLGNKDIKVPGEQESVGEESMLGSVDSALASNSSNWGLIKEENEQYSGFKGANTWSMAANISKITGSGFHITSSILAAYPYDKVTNAAKTVEYIGASASLLGDAFSLVSQGWRNYAEQQGMLASHIRRRDEWAFQSNQTLKELQQIDKQILANEIRINITKKERDNHIKQIEQAKAVDEVMRSKFSNEQLYQWMITQLSGLYFNAYRMALEMARRAERAAARELGVKPLNILGNDYWNSLREGLLAGERLHQDIKRLEVAYMDQNRREYELTKHVSLRRLNPVALVNLRIKDSNGHCRCEFDLPEWLFDLETPGHYLRRIKSVSVSIPGVVGPYASVNCKLTLLKSEVRHDRSLKTDKRYLRLTTDQGQPTDDDRFTDYFGASEAIVTSTGTGDSGLFETQLRDERFLPFEGSGVISSTWRLELPGMYPQFDYSTISDVVISIRYTAREGGDSLRDAATAAITKQLTPPAPPAPPAPPSTEVPLRFPLVLSCRSDFPTEWARAGTTSDLKIPINRNLLPYWMYAAKLVVREVKVADLLKASKNPLDFELKWPPKTGVAGTWPLDALDENGYGEGNLGHVATDCTDKILLLEIGQPSP